MVNVRKFYNHNRFLGLLFSISGFDLNISIFIAISIILLISKFLCVYQIVYKRNEWLKIVLIAVLVINVIQNNTIRSIFLLFSPGQTLDLYLMVLLGIVPLILELFAIYFLFIKSSSAWTEPASTVIPGSHSYVQSNQYWSKGIPITNKLFMLVSLLVMFVIHPFIIVTDALEIGSDIALLFYGIMFAPLIIFAVFYLYENKKLSARFSHTQSKTDTWLLVLIIIRNIVFILNFIPFIQIAGAMALVFGGIPYLIIYILLIRARSKII